MTVESMNADAAPSKVLPKEEIQPSKDVEAPGPSDPLESPQDMSLLRLFVTFLSIGFRAWGGPTVQINLMKEEFVLQKKWVTIEEFNRSLAIYQALPGPEAMEIACYLGMLARGRLGAFMAGLGFLLPGVGLVMLFSFIYKKYELLQNPGFNASFRCIQATIPALICRAVHRIGETSIKSKEGSGVDPILFSVAAMATVCTVMSVPFFLTLVVAGVLNLVSLWVDRRAVMLLAAACGLGSLIYAGLQGRPGELVMIAGLQTNNLLGTLFVTGLLAGLLTFGGAYTAIPFVQHAVVTTLGLLSQPQFLDGIAIVNLLPAPLVSFVTFVGFIAADVPGSILMTIGIFTPAFSFTIIGHNLFERLVHLKTFAHFLDGVTAGVVGLITISCLQLIKPAMKTPLDAVVFVVALGMAYRFTHRMTPVILVLFAAVAGQVFFIQENVGK